MFFPEKGLTSLFLLAYNARKRIDFSEIVRISKNVTGNTQLKTTIKIKKEDSP